MFSSEHFLEALREIASQLNAAGDTQYPSKAGEALSTHQPAGNQSHVSEVNPFQMSTLPESAYPKSVGGAFTNLHLQIRQFSVLLCKAAEVSWKRSAFTCLLIP